MKTNRSTSILILILILVSCSSDPHKAILNHWVVDTSKIDAEKYRGRKMGGEFEFKEDGTVNLYNEGKIMFSSTYAMASDGKSLVINGPAGERPLSFGVASISNQSLGLVQIENFKAGRDTLYFKPKR